MPNEPLHQELYTLDGVTYVVTVRAVKGDGFQGEWTCGQCDKTEQARLTSTSVGAAIEAAKSSFYLHHATHRSEGRGEASV